MMKFSVKVGLAAGVIYYLKEEGVWSDSQVTTNLYNKISSASQPLVDSALNQLPFEIPELPKTDQVSYVMKQYWNQGVTSTFVFLGDLPKTTKQLASCGIASIKNNKDLNNLFAGTETTSSEK